MSQENMAFNTEPCGQSEDERPLAIDLFAGLGGWAEEFLAENWRVVGFDIERHVYGEHRYPAQLVIQDVHTLHGSQFREAAVIVASPPCQEFSYMAMPWSLAKAKAAAIRADETGQMRADLTALFDACFRIQREASEAAGHHVPMIVENVRGAIPWVGRSRWNFGSFHFWGDVPGLMPIAFKGHKVPGISWSNSDKPGYVAKAFNGTAEQRLSEGVKVSGVDWHNYGKPGYSHPSFRDGVKAGGSWFGEENDCLPMRQHSSRSPKRKAASAMIAKIPPDVSRWIARCFKP